MLQGISLNWTELSYHNSWKYEHINYFFETVFMMAILDFVYKLPLHPKDFKLLEIHKEMYLNCFQLNTRKAILKASYAYLGSLKVLFKEDFYNKIKMVAWLFCCLSFWFVFENDFNTNFTQYYLFLLFYTPLLNFAQKPNKENPYYNALAYKLVTYLRKKKIDEKEAKHLLIDMLVASPYMYQTFDDLKSDIEGYKIFRTSMLNRWKDAEQIMQTNRRKDVDEVFLQNKKEAKKMFEKGYELEKIAIMAIH